VSTGGATQAPPPFSAGIRNGRRPLGKCSLDDQNKNFCLPHNKRGLLPMLFSVDLQDQHFIDPRGAPIDNRSALSIGRTFDEGFTYSYSHKEFVITSKHDSVEFFLKSHLALHDVEIAGLCCTLRNAIKKTERIDDVILPAGCIAGLKVSFQHLPELLLSIGLIVRIRQKGVQEDGVLLLCDPQVGSGPPSPV
jgi:hypothetical protein